MATINVFIVDDHEMFREGLYILLSKSDSFNVIGQAQNGKQAVDTVTAEVEIVLMDISMPEMNGIEATQILTKKFPGIKIIALSMFGDELYYYKMIHAGVKGFVLKESGSKEIEEAIEEVHNGGNFFSPELLNNIIVGIDEKAESGSVSDNIPEFTKTEASILKLLTTGMSDDEIANKTSLPKDEVSETITTLLDKTEMKNTVGLIIYAIQNNILKIS